MSISGCIVYKSFEITLTVKVSNTNAFALFKLETGALSFTFAQWLIEHMDLTGTRLINQYDNGRE